MGRPSKRKELLEAGVSVLHRRGYAAASVESITEQAGVPKGSFFNHFGSKEAFAVEALGSYFAHWKQRAEIIVADPSIAAPQKLERLLASIMARAQESSYSFGCMVGNLSAELSGQNEEVRRTVLEIFRAWALPYERVIAEGQASGHFSSRVPPAQAARFIVNGIQGALLRCKVERDSPPLDDLKDIVFGVLLHADPPPAAKV